MVYSSWSIANSFSEMGLFSKDWVYVEKTWWSNVLIVLDRTQPRNWVIWLSVLWCSKFIKTRPSIQTLNRIVSYHDLLYGIAYTDDLGRSFSSIPSPESPGNVYVKTGIHGPKMIGPEQSASKFTKHWTWTDKNSKISDRTTFWRSVDPC